MSAEEVSAPSIEDRIAQWYERVIGAAFWPLCIAFAVGVALAHGGGWRQMIVAFIAAFIGGVMLLAFGIPFIAGWLWVPLALGRWAWRKVSR